MGETAEYFEYDLENLLEAVRKRPGLWDPDHKDYKTKKIRAQRWQDIIAELVGDAELTKSDIRELELQIQKKWKCYRDSYIRYATNPEKWRHPYAHAERLKFLAKCVPNKGNKSTPNGAGSGVTSESEEEHKPRRFRSKTKVKLYRDSDNDNDNDEVDTSGCVAGDDQETNFKPFGEESFVYASVDPQPIRYEADDPDKMFLLSLLPHLKNIPESNRLSVKMDMMEVLRNSQYNK